MISRSVFAARCAAACVVAVCCAPLAACHGSGGPAAGKPAAAPSTSGPAAQTAPPSSASPTASAQPSAGTAAAACSTSDLAISVAIKEGGAAAGSTYYPIDFTNTGGTACALEGYPGVSFVSGQGGGSEVGAPANRGSGTSATKVILPPGAAAHADLQVVDAGNYSASTCHPVTAHWLRVYPPGQTKPGFAAFTAQVCSAKLPPNLGNSLSVFPVRSGQGKMGQTP